MNAHTPILTPLAVQNADVLRELKTAPHTTIAGLARAIGRDADNLRKTLKALEGAGLVGPPDGETGAFPALTDWGCDALAAIERAENPAPAGATSGDSLAASGFAQLILQQIEPDPLNPRKEFDPEAIAELADSIARDGLLENLVVRPGRIEGLLTAPLHRLVAGERRWRAIKLLIERGAWPKDRPIMCKVVDIDDAAHRRIALVENLQRKDLRPIDEARALKELMDLEQIGTAEVAKEIGFTQRFVQQRVQLLELQPMHQVMLQEGKMTIEEGRREVARMREREADAKAKLLPPDELLAFAEIRHAIHHRAETIAGWFYGEKPVAIGYRTLEDGEVVAKLVARGALEITQGFRSDPRVFVRGGYRLSAKDLEAQLPGLLGKDGRRVLHVLRRQVIGEAEANRIDATWAPNAQGPGEYATWGLNSPFAETARSDLQAAADAYVAREQERTAEDFRRKVREEEAAEARRRLEADIAADSGERGQAILAKVRAFEADACDLAPEAFIEHFGVLMAECDLAGPLTLNWSDTYKLPVLFTAAGKVMSGAAYALEAHRRLITIALNFAQGVPIYSGPDFDAPYNKPVEAPTPQAEVLPREEFVGVVADYLLEGDDDLPEDDDQARAIVETQADVALTEFLEFMGVEYGDPSFDWNDEGADRLATSILERDRICDEDADDDLPDSVKALATGTAKPIAGDDGDEE